MRLLTGSERQKIYHKKLREKLFEILNQKSCVKCSFSDKRALNFHHKNGGGNNDVKKHGYYWAMLRYYINNPNEAKKELQVLCANHNQITRIKNHEQ